MGFSVHSCHIRFTCIYRKFAVQGMLGFLPEKVPMSAQGGESQQDLRAGCEEVRGCARCQWSENSMGRRCIGAWTVGFELLLRHPGGAF